MQRTTIVAPEGLIRELKRITQERHTSMATLVRGALEDMVKRHRPRPRGLGIGASGLTDSALRAGNERTAPRSWR